MSDTISVSPSRARHLPSHLLTILVTVFLVIAAAVAVTLFVGAVSDSDEPDRAPVPTAPADPSIGPAESCPGVTTRC